MNALVVCTTATTTVIALTLKEVTSAHVPVATSWTHLMKELVKVLFLMI